VKNSLATLSLALAISALAAGCAQAPGSQGFANGANLQSTQQAQAGYAGYGVNSAQQQAAEDSSNSPSFLRKMLTPSLPSGGSNSASAPQLQVSIQQYAKVDKGLNLVAHYQQNNSATLKIQDKQSLQVINGQPVANLSPKMNDMVRAGSPVVIQAFADSAKSARVDVTVLMQDQPAQAFVSRNGWSAANLPAGAQIAQVAHLRLLVGQSQTIVSAKGKTVVRLDRVDMPASNESLSGALIHKALSSLF